MQKSATLQQTTSRPQLPAPKTLRVDWRLDDRRKFRAGRSELPGEGSWLAEPEKSASPHGLQTFRQVAPPPSRSQTKTQSQLHLTSVLPHCGDDDYRQGPKAIACALRCL